MQIKYLRSLSGIPESSSSNESNQIRRALFQQPGLDAKFQSINQRLQHQRKHLTTLHCDYNTSNSSNNQILKEPKMQNFQKLVDSDKENLNQFQQIKIPTFGKDVLTKQLKEVSLEKQEYFDLANKGLINQYGRDVIDYLQLKELTTTPKDFLANHSIPTSLRAKMIDWMIEVMSSYKCSEQTFFISARIMDYFLWKVNKPQEINDLHLIGVTAMFIASKYEEIHPMKLKIVHEKIAHRKLTIEQIKSKESQIFETLNFQLDGGTIFEIYNWILYKIDLKRSLNEKHFKYLQRLCIYLAKMILFEYELVCKYDYFQLSGALIFVAFKIIEQLDQNFSSEMKMNEIILITQQNQDKLIEAAQKVLTLAKTFEKLYPNFENLKKFNSFQLEVEDEESRKI